MSDHVDPSPHGWRGVVATWSAAAWIVMQQFGVTSPSSAGADTRIVRVESASRSMADAETLPDGRVLTIPVEIVSGPEGRNREPGQIPRKWSNLN